MFRGTRTDYTGKRNKWLISTFQPPEEGWGVQRLKRCDKHGDKDEEISPKNVNKWFYVSYWIVLFDPWIEAYQLLLLLLLQLVKLDLKG